ncbi:hypothetical protein ACPPVO_59425 [Dactylosporangium sp. McL0621]|uniref:hypothetical protein n=1 Tax=Dactylosporangium sp. McL0621 TaxID=3415678 RepID=UPI003CE6E82D
MPPSTTENAASTASGCDTLLDLFQSGPADAARFEAGTSGPFLAESLAPETDINSMAGTCARFTDADDEGDTTNVSVAPEQGFPDLGADQHVFKMTASGGTR